jgi:hypothetical protein
MNDGRVTTIAACSVPSVPLILLVSNGSGLVRKYLAATAARAEEARLSGYRVGR